MCFWISRSRLDWTIRNSITVKKARPDYDFLKTLRTAELFAKLLEEDLLYLASKTEVKAFFKNEEIFKPGDEAKQFFMVLSGTVVISRQTDSGREMELARFLEGEAFGDFDFVMRSKFNARAAALEDSALLLFPSSADTLESLALECPGAVSRLLLRSLAMMSSRLSSTNRLISENTPWIQELRKQIFLDPLTGLWNRTFFDEELPRFLVRPTLVVMIKPDRFKELNDSRGHTVGDEVMARFASLLLAEVERFGRGWAVRMRSNEMAVVVPRGDITDRDDLVQRLLEGTAGIGLPADGLHEAFELTPSMAFAVWPSDAQDWKELIKKTNEKLTEAWKDGGNRTYSLFSPPSEGL